MSVGESYTAADQIFFLHHLPGRDERLQRIFIHPVLSPSGVRLLFTRGNESVRLVTSWALSLWHYDTLKERLMCVCCSDSRRAAGCDATSLRGGFQDLKNVCFHRQTVRQGGREGGCFRARHGLKPAVCFDSLNVGGRCRNSRIFCRSVCCLWTVSSLCACLFCEVSFQSDRLLFWSPSSIYEDVTHIFQQTD